MRSHDDPNKVRPPPHALSCLYLQPRHVNSIQLQLFISQWGFGEAAEEERATNQDDRGCPSEAIGPVVDVINSGIIMKPEGLCVLHGIDNQGDDLEYS